MRASLFLVLALLPACATSASDPGAAADASLDGASTSDARADGTAPATDGGATDGATSADAGGSDADASVLEAGVDASGSTCSSDGECRLFASYCDGCTCLGLRKTDPDPKCAGTIVSCILNPCTGKTATCAGNACGVK